MPRSRANLYALMTLLVLLAAAGWLGGRYREYREDRIAADREMILQEAKRQAALEAQRVRRENLPARRFIPPDPIVVPFY